MHRILALCVLVLAACTDTSGQPTSAKQNLSATVDCTRRVDLDTEIGTRLTASEIDVVRRQIAKCWNTPYGAFNPKELVVDLRIEVNRDRTVKNLCILDSARMDSDRAFRAMAESAKKAFLHPYCRHLKLPSEKYDGWKVITLHFDPTPYDQQ